MTRKHKLFETAEKRLKSELDVTEILLLLRKLRTIIYLLLNKEQATMLEYQKLNMICSSGSNTPLKDPDFESRQVRPVRNFEITHFKTFQI